MLKSTDLGFAYSPEVGFDFPDIHCESGETLLILGESGTGKTTLLHLLSGLLKPTKGNIYIGDTDITQLNTKELDFFRGQLIGLIFQVSHFVSALSVRENLMLAPYLAGLRPEQERAERLLSQLNLDGKAKRKTYQLSQGQQQRVAIARALMNKPELILADEPTSSLDDTNCYAVAELLEEQAKEANAALVIVTHDQRLKEKFSNQISL